MLNEWHLSDGVYKSFVKSIREDSRYRHSRIVTLIEDDGGHLTADKFEEYLLDRAWGLKPVYCMINPRDPDARPGVPTKGWKMRYVAELQTRFSRNAIHFDETIISSDPVLMLKTLRKQSESYIIEEKKLTNPSFTDQRRFGATGKPFGRDDAIMALQILNSHGMNAMYTDDTVIRGASIYPLKWISETGHSPPEDVMIANATTASSVPIETPASLLIQTRPNLATAERAAKLNLPDLFQSARSSAPMRFGTLMTDDNDNWTLEEAGPSESSSSHSIIVDGTDEVEMLLNEIAV